MNSLSNDEPNQDPPVLGDPSPAAQPPKSSRVIGFIQIAAIATFMIAAIWFAQERNEPASSVGADTSVQPAAVAGDARLVVQVLRPEVQSAAETLVATGSVAVRNPVALVSQVSGRIQTISSDLKVGGAFAAGDLLLRIDPQDFELALAQAQAEIDSAQANLALQQAQSEAAIANYALLNGRKAVPPLVAKLPQIQQGRALLAGAKARAEVARLNLARTELRMPFAGKVTGTSAEVGQLLTQGVAFGEVFALDAVEAIVPIAPTALSRLQPIVGRTATIRAGSQEVTASVDRVAAELDAQTRFARLYLKLPADSLPPGTFVEASFAGPQLDNTLSLPIESEQPNGRLWVVKDSRLVAITPKLHFRTATQLVVDAFPSGDGIVVGSVPSAREGMPVAVTLGE